MTLGDRAPPRRSCGALVTCLILALSSGVSARFVEKGCYRDDRSAGQLSRDEYRSTRDIFPVNGGSNGFQCDPASNSRAGISCQVHCLGKHTRYFYFRGLVSRGSYNTASNRCYCVDTLPGPLGTFCNYSPCGSGDSVVQSGGKGNENPPKGYGSVYKVFDSTYCYQVPNSGAPPVVKTSDLSLARTSHAARCREHCLREQVPFFGLRQGEHKIQCRCFTGTNLPLRELVSNTSCDLTCDGDDAIPCGGRDRHTSIYTVCPLGYRLAAVNGLCSQICQCPSGVCHQDGSCVQCPDGYTGHMCQEDVDECSDSSLHNCSGLSTCHNTQGGFECRCPAGYELTRGQYVQYCIEVDECSRDASLCENGQCHNTDGSFYCTCNSGYELATGEQACRDKDECQNRWDNWCPRDGTGICHNTPGDYYCECNHGYELYDNNHRCRDIDECVRNSSLCADGRCENDQGSYHCQCDEQHFRQARDRKSCIDIDECYEGSDTCPSDPGVGSCHNTHGDYTCLCASGYQLTADRHHCQDTDECLDISTPKCVNGQCENTVGSYYCICDEGFDNKRLDNTSCVDIEECELYPHFDLCGNGTCENIIGNYTCSCHHGYSVVDGGRICEDVDECAEEADDCNHGDCHNTDGSYSCNCHEGYTASGDGKMCLEEGGLAGENGVVIPVVIAVLCILGLGAVIGAVLFYKKYRARRTSQSAASTSTPQHPRRPAPDNGTTLKTKVRLDVVGAGKGATVQDDANGAASRIKIPGTSGKGATQINIVNKINQNVHINIAPPEGDAPTRSNASRPKVTPKPRSQPAKATNQEEHLYGNVSATGETLLDEPSFLAYVATEKKREEPFKDEYTRLPTDPSFPCEAASLPDLKPKNRFKNILPYDYNRVKLQKRNNDPLSDYINASYIQGYGDKDKFIAALGPRPKTLEDFWRMVLEQKCHVILMLTNLVEDGVNKCEQYWPEYGSVQYGAITVRLISIEQKVETVTRKLNVSMKGGQTLDVTQIHFTVWPDHGVPRYCASLVRLQNTLSRSMVPGHYTVIHCSAGVGRTGTMIAIDYLLKQLKAENRLDVFSCVQKLREQRVTMVQTWHQYVFLYDVMTEYLKIGDTRIPTYQLKQAVSGLTWSEGQGESQYSVQHKILTNMAPIVDVYDNKESLNKVNKPKNRDTNILPQSSKRPTLKTTLEGHNDYINAVTVPDINKKDAFIVTQIPLENTVSDFWRLVIDYDVHTVVVLATTSQQQEVAKFLPSDRNNKYVSTWTFGLKSERQTGSNITTRVVTMATCDGESSEAPGEYINTADLLKSSVKVKRTISVLIHTQQDTELLDDQGIMDLHSAIRELKNTGPIVVIDMNGCQFCGQYVACSSLLDMCNREKLVDVFHIVQLIKDSRPQFIDSVKQYKHLFDVVSRHVGDFDQYGNVYTGM